MKSKQKGSALIGLVSLITIMVVISSWIVNLIHLTDCDFESPYKCEIIHLAGLVPPVALVTAWIGDDSNKVQK